MCERFAKKFVDKVIEKLEQDKKYNYVVMFIDSDTNTKSYPPSKVCSFKSTKIQMPSNLYDAMMKEKYYMVYVIKDLYYKYPDIFHEEIKNMFIDEDNIDYLMDEELFVCEKFDNYGGEKVFHWLNENVEGGLLEIFDKLEVNCGHICLLCDSGNVFKKLSNNGLDF